MGRHSAPETDGVRRVRTPAGVAHFNLPIDSPIGQGKHPSIANATPKQVGDATRAIVKHLQNEGTAGGPRDYGLPAATNEILATNATGDDIGKILDRHKVDAPEPEHTDWVRPYDALTVDTAEPEEIAEISTALAFASQYDDADLTGLTQEHAINAILQDGVNVPHMMDDSGTSEGYNEIRSRLQKVLDAKREALEEEDGWNDNRANGLDPFEGYSTTYRGSDVDTVSRKTVLGMTDSISEWFDYENADYISARNGRLTEGATMADFDIPAAENDIIAAGLNVQFLTGSINDDYEITDTEFDEIGRDMWTILQNHRRGYPDTTEANVPPVDIDTLRGAELAEHLSQGYAALSATYRGAEEVAPEDRVALIARAMDDGLNLAALNNPNLPDVTRNSIVARLHEHRESLE